MTMPSRRDLDLDAAAEELSAARREVKIALTLAAALVDQRAAEGDPAAQEIAAAVNSAFARLIAANIVGATAIKENS